MDLELEIGAHLEGERFEEAATAAIRGYGPQVLAYLIKALQDETLGQEAFGIFAEELWKTMGTFRRDCSFRTWAYRIAWSAAKRVGRDAYRRRSRPLGDGRLSRLAAEVRTQTAAYLRTEAKDRLAGLRDTLSLEDQTLLLLRVDRGLSWKEVAEVMAPRTGGAGPAALAKRFERLKKRLKEALAAADRPPSG